MAAAPDLKEKAGLSSLARATMICGASRDKLRVVIGEAGLLPAGEDAAGNPMYRTFDLIVACYLRGVRPPDSQVFDTVKPNKPQDPADLPAAARNAWFQSESKRLDLLQRMANLLPAEEFERMAAEMCTAFAQFLEALPDTMERDGDLTPQQVERLATLTERERERLYQELAAKWTPKAEAKTG